jgi:hypothetical protein
VIGASGGTSSKGYDVTDISKLSDDELDDALEQILKKTEGESESDATPTFRIVREFVDPTEPTADKLCCELIAKMAGDADTMALVAASRVFGLSSEQFLHCLWNR